MVLLKAGLIWAEFVSKAVWLVIVTRTMSFGSFFYARLAELDLLREVLLEVAFLVIHIAPPPASAPPTAPTSAPLVRFLSYAIAPMAAPTPALISASPSRWAIVSKGLSPAQPASVAARTNEMKRVMR